MKTLLEWLEDNRSMLPDGVYAASGAGGICRDGKYISGTTLSVSSDTEKYKVKNGSISLITPYNQAKENKYNRQCKGVKIDVYDVLKAFEVTDPALQHLVKKALCAGLRGYKTLEQDLQEVLESAKRAVELNK